MILIEKILMKKIRCRNFFLDKHKTFFRFGVKKFLFLTCKIFGGFWKFLSEKRDNFFYIYKI